MNVKQVLKLSRRALQTTYAPNELVDDEITAAEAAKAISKVIGFVYPDMESDRLQKIIPCINCTYATAQRKHNRSRLVCSRLNMRVSKEFFCGYAKETKNE